jgi:hypothetical protein
MNTLLANTLIAAAGIIRGTLASAFNYLNTLIKSGTQGAMQFHQEGIAFAREMGMNAKEAQAYTEVLTDRTEKLAMKYGVAAEQVKELQRNISVATSRQLMLNESQAEGFLQLNKLVGSSTVTKFTEEMMNGMGGQLDTVQGAVSKAYATAAKSGLNAQKVSEKIANNLSMANKLSFRTGIDGLTRMAMQAEKVGMSLSTVESVANNFMEIDSAIEHSAMLNMLGGAAGIFGGNPLDMAYEANNDPEALQKRITSALGGLASFDSTKGIASMNGLNMDFARNIAKALGMSPDEAVRVAKKQAEVGFKEQKFGAQFDKLGLNQEQRDFLINKSTVRDGQMFYTDTNGKEHNLGTEGITDEVLKEMMKYEGKSDRDIMEENARSLTSINEILTGIKESIKAMFAKFVEGLFPKMQGDLKQFGAWAKNKLEPLAKNVGESVRGAYEWLKEHKEPIKSFIGHVIGFLKFATEHWKILLSVLAAKKLFGMASNLGVGKKLGRSAARGAANGITNIASRLHQGSPHAIGSRIYNFQRAGGRGFFGSSLEAIKGSWRGASKLAKGTALLGIGASAMEGIGAWNAHAKEAERIRNSNMSEAEKTKALEQNRIDRNSEVGGAVGQGVGTILGTFFFGPLGGMIGGAVGKFAGEFIGKYWDPIWNGIINVVKTLGKVIGSGLKFLIDNNPIAWMARGIGKLFGKDWSPSKLIGDLFGGGEKHAKGGVIGGNSYTGDKVPILANSGEAVITPQQFNAAFGETPVKPKKSLGEAEYVYKPNRTETSSINGNTITVKDFNININGTLKLDGGKSYKNIDVNELLRDQAFMTSLKNMIKTSINQDINGGRFMNDLATVSGFPAQTSIYGKHANL